MTYPPPASRFFNPLALWADVGFHTQQMLLDAGSVIQLRTQRIAEAGLSPTEDDLAEMQLMGSEKLEAIVESGAAMANQLHTAQFTLPQRAARQWLGDGVPLARVDALDVNRTPPGCPRYEHFDRLPTL